MSEDHIPEQRRSRWITLLLVLVPAWMAGSAAIAVWYYYHRLGDDEVSRGIPRTVTVIQPDDLAKTLEKITGFIGERNSQSPQGARGLESMMAMIDGILGPGNTGYRIERIPGPETGGKSWPLVIAEVPGASRRGPAIWVVVPCDSLPGSTGAMNNGSGVAASIAVARELSSAEPDHSIFFAFVPHGIDPAGPVEAMTRTLQTRISRRQVAAVLVVGPVSGKEGLKRAPSPAAAAVHGGGAVQPFSAEESRVAALLADAGLPVSLVTAGPVEDGVPDPTLLAKSSQALKDLVLSLASKN